MKARAKTTQRLLILIAGAFFVIAGFGGYYVYRKQLTHKDYLERRAKGMAAFEAGDYETAQASLASYIRNRNYAGDHAAIFTLAEAALRNEQPEGSHLVIAAGQYKRFLELQPHRDDVRLELMRLYRQLGYSTEALTVADQLLLANKNNQEALRIKALALAGLKRPQEALQFARAAVAPGTGNPKDVQSQYLILQLYMDPRVKAEADKDPVNADVGASGRVTAGQTVLKRALKLLRENPEDGRFEMLLSHAYLVCGEIPEDHREELRRVLASEPATRPTPDALASDSPQSLDNRAAATHYAKLAAKRPVADIDHLRLLVEQLEFLALPAETLEVVMRAENAVSDPSVRKLLIRRLFETERYEELEQRLAKLTLNLKRPDDVEAMGMKGAALIRLNREPEVRAIIEALSSQASDKMALAWAAVLRHILTPQDPKIVAEACREAVRVDRSSPYMSYFLGRAYEEMDERPLAIENYRRAGGMSPLWALPPRRLAHLLSASGEARQAQSLSLLSYRLQPTDEGLIEYLVITADVLGIDEAAASEGYVKAIAYIQATIPGEERTLPVYVQILSRRNDQAALRKVLDGALTATPPRPERILLRLAALARQLKITDPQPAAFIDAAQKHHGVTADSAYARALDLLQSGRRDEAIASLTAAIKGVPAEKDLYWRMALAQLLEVARDPGASQAWIALADDPRAKAIGKIQRAALGAQSVQHDYAFIRRAGERLRGITGDQGLGWKVAQAKVLMSDRTKPNIPEATRLLKEVVAASPVDAEARVLLSVALEQSGDVRGAIEQAVNALKVFPDAPQVRLMLATLYSAESDFAKARDQIMAIPRERLTPEQVGQAARLLHQQGDTATAVSLLEQLPADQVDAGSAALQAELYRRRNEPAKAEALFARLIDNQGLAGPRDALITAYADFLAASGRMPEAQAMLGRLDAIKLPPGRKDLLLAEFYVRRGESAKALDHYRAAVKAAPGTEPAWRALIGANLGSDRVAEALADANQALKTLPEALHFIALTKNADLVSEAAQHRRLMPLLVAMLQDPQDAAVIIEALRVYVEAARNREAPVNTLSKLRPIAERAPRTTTLRAMLVEEYTAIGNFPVARDLAVRAAESSPNSLELARLAAETQANVGDHRAALRSAQRWRELSQGDPLRVDLFSANVHIATGEPDLAIKQIEAHIKSPPVDATAHRDLLAVHSLALIRKREFDKAAEVLRPHLQRGAEWRQLWLERSMLQAADAPAVAKRLEELERFVPPSATDERVVVAAAWYQLSAISNSAAYRDRAAQMIDALLPKSKSPLAHFTRALINEAEADDKAAEVGYRKTLELKPDQPFALNNLAMLILRRKGDPAEARTLSARAVAARPNVATFYDTHAQALIAEKDYRGAITQLRTAVKLEPGNVEWKVRLAEAHGANREMLEAGRVLDDVDALVKDKSKLPEDLRKQIQRLRERINGRA